MKKQKEVIYLKDTMYELQLEAATRAVEEVNAVLAENGIVGNIEKLPAKGFFDVYNKICADLSRAESVDIKGLDIEGNFSKAKEYIANTIRIYLGDIEDKYEAAKNGGFNFASSVLEYELVMNSITSGAIWRKQNGEQDLASSPLMKDIDVFCINPFDNNILDGDQIVFKNGRSLDGRFFTSISITGVQPVFRREDGGLFIIVHILETLETPTEDLIFAIRSNDSNNVSKNIFLAQEKGYRFFLLPNSKGKQGDGLYVESMKRGSTGQLIKIISCDIVGDKAFITNFCGEVKVDDVLFNVIKKDSYGEDIKSATLLLRKA
ncbi:MAG: hypothetical protein ACFN0J_10505 [Segatella salivae]